MPFFLRLDYAINSDDESMNFRRFATHCASLDECKNHSLRKSLETRSHSKYPSKCKLFDQLIGKTLELISAFICEITTTKIGCDRFFSRVSFHSQLNKSILTHKTPFEYNSSETTITNKHTKNSHFLQSIDSIVRFSYFSSGSWNIERRKNSKWKHFCSCTRILAYIFFSRQLINGFVRFWENWPIAELFWWDCERPHMHTRANDPVRFSTRCEIYAIICSFHQTLQINACEKWKNELKFGQSQFVFFFSAGW